MHAHVNCIWLLVVILLHPESCAARTCISTKGSMDARAIWYIFPVPTNCRVLRADGHFTVARTLYYPYHQLWVPWSKCYLVHITPLPPIMAYQKCVCGHVWGDPVPTNCRVLRADGHSTVTRNLY